MLGLKFEIGEALVLSLVIRFRAEAERDSRDLSMALKARSGSCRNDGPSFDL